MRTSQHHYLRGVLGYMLPKRYGLLLLPLRDITASPLSTSRVSASVVPPRSERVWRPDFLPNDDAVRYKACRQQVLQRLHQLLVTVGWLVSSCTTNDHTLASAYCSSAHSYRRLTTAFPISVRGAINHRICTASGAGTFLHRLAQISNLDIDGSSWSCNRSARHGRMTVSL